MKAHIADNLLYRHWTEWTPATRSHLFIVSPDGAGLRDVTSGVRYDVPPGPLKVEISGPTLVTVKSEEVISKGKKLSVIGLDDHVPMSSHPLAARKAPAAREPAKV